VLRKEIPDIPYLVALGIHPLVRPNAAGHPTRVNRAVPGDSATSGSDAGRCSGTRAFQQAEA
jgi:hypothetical protein